MARNKKLRARNAAIRMIARRDKITFRQAEKKFPRARLEVTVNGPRLKVLSEYLRKADGKWYKLKTNKKTGKPLAPRFSNTYGKGKTESEISKVRHLEQYWNVIRLYAETYGIPLKDSRYRFSKLRLDMGTKGALRWMLTDLGVYDDRDVVSP